MLGLGLDMFKGRTGISSGSSVVSQWVPMSWGGVNQGEYTYGLTTPTTSVFNEITRDGAPQSFLMVLFADQTFESNERRVFRSDVQINSTFYSIGLASDTGVNYTNLEYALWGSRSGGTVNWFWYESGSNVGLDVPTTTVGGNIDVVRYEYDGANEIKAYINNVLVKTVTTSYSSDTLKFKVLGRNANSQVGKNIGVRTSVTSSKLWVALGDSWTDGMSTELSNIADSGYVYRTIDETNHDWFTAKPAKGGNRTDELITGQLPSTGAYYNVGYTNNVATVMIGLNDIITGSTVAAIQTNMQTIVTDLQAQGYYVVMITIPRVWTVDYADRYTVNSWMLLNSMGADAVWDITTLSFETSDVNMMADKIHPNVDGQIEIAQWIAPKLQLL